ncbi:class I SAM-dependent methyltransferase [Eilatimonas milleporae]|uniref:Putative zinc binding protein n=1 Tax=Eilatimonas milleporae TaxID=911205 RepID=A0A3M0CNE3_9PROT|nr:class I SAM-dependent methyltransferase [Eilatimonas milleporae]RMB04773.1 putative zinc binding protein [Eilatimonas milleporae]
MPGSRQIDICQNCGSGALEPLLFLGHLPPVNALPDSEGLGGALQSFPLNLVRCGKCGLVQIGYIVAPDVLFPESYPYRSGVTASLRRNFEDLARDVAAVMPLSRETVIVDIGSNDGTLLNSFKDSGACLVGIEPSDAARDAIAAGIPTVQDYFRAEAAAKAVAIHGPPSLVTATNMFAHADDVHGIVADIKAMLAPGALVVIENHYLVDLVETLQYDTIYHEHMRYYSVKSMMDVMARHGFTCFDAKPIPTHGGSIRCFFTLSEEAAPSDRLRGMLAREKALGFDDGSALVAFAGRVVRHRRALQTLLNGIADAGHSVFGIGAPSRASTLVSYACPHADLIAAVCELPGSPKIGHYLPGTQIPIIDETRLYEEQPDYALVLSWHIADEIIANIRKRGFRGKVIIPLPDPVVVDTD